MGTVGNDVLDVKHNVHGGDGKDLGTVGHKTFSKISNSDGAPNCNKECGSRLLSTVTKMII